MTLALAALSHAPTFGVVDPGPGVQEDIGAAIDSVKAFVSEFDPEVVIAFGPDHFNGVLYEMMPPFCIGAQAQGIGDWGTTEGPLPVDSDTARYLVKEVLDAGIDVARSERLKVDHGVLQPIEFLFGRAFDMPFVPVFVNAVGAPLTPLRRVRQFGEAIGHAVRKLDKRVLFLASGGLSHDPPIPSWDNAPEPVRARITSAVVTLEERKKREATILAATERLQAGTGEFKELNEAFDAVVLQTFRTGDLQAVDGWTNEWLVGEGGSGAQEIRSWIAAYSALATAGPYSKVVDRYWPVHAWGTGFSVQADVSQANR